VWRVPAIAAVLIGVLLLAAPAAQAADEDICGYTTMVVNKNIPDGAPIGATATSSKWLPPVFDTRNDSLTDVNISVNVTHPAAKDLDISVSHAGTTVSLTNLHGAGTNTTFDDEAGAPISSATSPFNGPFRPESPLSAFDGLASKGVWTLKVRDHVGTSSGEGSPPPQKLVSWTIAYGSESCPGGDPPCDENGSFSTRQLTQGSISFERNDIAGSGFASTVQVHIGKVTAADDTKVDFTLRNGNNHVRKLMVGAELSGGTNFVNTVFDDSVVTPITSGSGTYTGSFTPKESLNGFAGIPVAGTWELAVANNGSTPVTVDSWGMTVRSTSGCNDTDDDVVYDANDNCPTVSNSGQENYGFDVEGDACDADDDNDGVEDTADACPRSVLTQFGQFGPDYDADGCNDGEDADDDNDGTPDTADACPQATKGAGGDNDGDGCKDFEDADDDGDGVADGADDCPLVANGNQADRDRDKAGDACDPDDDGDGVIDTADAFPLDATRSSLTGVPRGQVAPTLSKLKLLPSRFRAAVGTTVTYATSTSSLTRFTVLRPARGVKQGKRCVKPARHRKGKRCTRLVSVGTFSHSDATGNVTLRFSGRVGKKPKPLKAGRYVLRAQGRNTKGAGKAVQAKFTIVKR
jgi:subtilisin-like proprotein convertase family protein